MKQVISCPCSAEHQNPQRSRATTKHVYIPRYYPCTEAMSYTNEPTCSGIRGKTAQRVVRHSVDFNEAWGSQDSEADLRLLVTSGCNTGLSSEPRQPIDEFISEVIACHSYDRRCSYQKAAPCPNYRAGNPAATLTHTAGNVYPGYENPFPSSKAVSDHASVALSILETSSRRWANGGGPILIIAGLFQALAWVAHLLCGF